MPRRDKNGLVVIRETEYEDGPQYNGNHWAFLPMAFIAVMGIIIGFCALVSATYNTFATGLLWLLN